MTGAAAGALGVGVLGASSMVHGSVVRPAILAVPGVELVHEASSSAMDGQRDGVRTSSRYEAVLADPDVDLVYLPLPNHLHEQWVTAAAAAGKHVLCEKPLGVDAAAGRRMAAACERAGVQLLEAYMSPFHPRSAAIAEAVALGRIGRVVHASARMCGHLPEGNHRWTVAAGGGALLDVGIYCLEPALSALGWDGAAPVAVAASSVSGGDGVDASTSAWLDLGGGRTASLFTSFAAADQQHLSLVGTEGTIEVDVRHATPDRRDRGYLLRHPDGTVEEVDTPTGDCYEGMVAHVRDVLDGTTAPLRPPARSVAVAEVIDLIAAAAGHARTGGPGGAG